MTWIVAKFKWIMLLAGLASCAAFWGAIEPKEAERYLFDKALKGDLGDMVVRNWAVLLTLVGVMLIYGAFQPQHRTPILVGACISKGAFLVLMLAFGRDYFEEKAGWAFAAELGMLALFVTFMIGMRGISSGRYGSSMGSMSQQAMPPTPRTAVHIPPRPPAAKVP
jgi:hypothetical protein